MVDIVEDNVNESGSSPSANEEENQSRKRKTTKKATTNRKKPPLPPKAKPSGSGSGKSNRKSSHVWKHFEKLPKVNPKDPNEAPKCMCIYCGNEFNCATSNGTSHLNNHFRKTCKQSPFRNDEDKQKVLSFEPLKEGEKSLVAVAFNKEACRVALAKYIVTDELPYRHVEGEGFKEFVRTLQPRFEIPSRITIARDVLKCFCEEKEKLKDILKSQRVSITTDTWTSIQNLNYMVITAHWIDDDFNYQKRIITFCIVEDHRGDTIAAQIHESLDAWGITKLFAITVDNASSNDVAIRSLRQKYGQMTDGLILNGKFLHMRCCAHIINLIVVEGLKEKSHSISAIRNAVRYVRSSPARLKIFKEHVEKAKIECKGLLKLDVPTRWNSTFLMLNTALKFKDAFNSWLKDLNYKAYFEEFDKDGNKRDGPPIESDWENAKVFVRFLGAFHEITMKFSGSTYVTSNKYFITISGIQQQLYKLSLAENEDLLLVSMAKSMKEKYDKYWGSIDKCNEALLIALVLDPRYKLKYLHHCFRKLHDPITSNLMVNKIETSLRTLFEAYGGYEQLQQPSSVAASQSEDITSVDNTNTFSSDSYSFLSDDMHVEFLQERIEQYGEVSKDELDKYFISDDVEPIKVGQPDRFDILKWWCLNSSKYPTLAKIARDVLAVPVTTVASEAAFSTGGRILDPFRSSLNPTTVEALICLKNWWSQSHQPIVVREYEEEEESLPTMEDLAIDSTPTNTAATTSSATATSSMQSTNFT